MIRNALIPAGAIALCLLGPLATQAPRAQAAPVAMAASAETARVIVKFRTGASILRRQSLSAVEQQGLQAEALGRRLGIALSAGRGLSERSHVVVAQGLTSQQLAARIAAEADVEYAVVDGRKRRAEVPNDSYFSAGPAVGVTSGGPVVGQWYLKTPGAAGTAANTAPSSINAQQAWDVTRGSANIVVAILDTGLRFDHPDLQGGNVLPGYDLVTNDLTGADGQPGRDADASDPGDYVTSADVSAGTPGCSSSDAGDPSSWHGTQMAGIIGAATGNGTGIASVGHGVVRIMPVRVIGKCGGVDSDIAAGILWAVGLQVPGLPLNPTPARVLNLSLGGPGSCSAAYLDAISQANAAGAVVVIAAGNTSSGGIAVSEPANCAGAIAVGGLRSDGDKDGFANLGPEVAISAPGGNCGSGAACQYPIISTVNAGTTTPVAASAAYTDAFNYAIGTSYSTPLVAGTAALLLSVNPALTPAQVKARLQATARPFVTSGSSVSTGTCRAPSSTGQSYCYCTTTTCGAGMLDAYAVVQGVAGVQAGIALTTTTPTAGQSVALTSSSTVTSGRTVASYAWTILNAGTTGAVITSAANADSVTVLPASAGIFLIQLTATDNTGATSTTTLSVTVAAAATTTTPPTSTPTAPASSGGGGALGAGWLALLLTAVLALAGSRRRWLTRAQRAARLSATRASRTG